MDKNLFSKLTESMIQMNEIIEGKRVPSREVAVEAVKIKSISHQATYYEKNNSFRTPD
ncbi:hypothetical protein ACP179_17850 [Xenorhabdus stockiae]|uniref:hypothetical protein n=1 Tax=Xenorhabdus stockiae TaxID=351614 RepID=UPI003CF09585